MRPTAATAGACLLLLAAFAGAFPWIPPRRAAVPFADNRAWHNRNSLAVSPQQQRQRRRRTETFLPGLRAQRAPEIPPKREPKNSPAATAAEDEAQLLLEAQRDTAEAVALLRQADGEVALWEQEPAKREEGRKAAVDPVEGSNPKPQSNDGGGDGGGIDEEEATVPSSIEGDDFAIPLKVYLSPSSPPRAAAFFIHGGIFAYGDRDSHPTIAWGLANLGMAVVTASFRNGDEAPHKTNITIRDLRDVVDYARGRWGDLPFGLVGSSSGGFFALTLSQALGPSSVSFCIPICPVADPFKRASYLRSSMAGSARADGYTAFHDPKRSAHILEKQLSFWRDDASMREAGEALKANKKEVPTLLIVGSCDKNVPLDVTADVQSWATRTIVIGGRGHELCDEVVEGGGYHCYLADIDRFLDYCLLQKDVEGAK